MYNTSTCQQFLHPFDVAVGLLAVSLTSFLSHLLSILEGRPVLDNVTVVPYSLQLLTVSTVFHVLSNALARKKEKHTKQ